VEGKRPTVLDNPVDNFKFRWSTSPTGGWTDIPNAVINKSFELDGGLLYPFSTPTSPTTIYIRVEDTNQTSGTGLDTVQIDKLAIQ
jgi:hypothetical protein